MLTYRLTHPGIRTALAGAGHGSTVLVAHANSAHGTGTRPGSPIVHLNLRPREQFRATCRSTDLTLTVTTGDHRFHAKALLTIRPVLRPDRADDSGRSAPDAARP